MKIKLANGNKYVINKASETLDFDTNQTNLEMNIVGSNAEEAYKAFLNDIKVETNLENIVIERDIENITIPKVELVFTALNIFENSVEGFVAFKIIEA